MFSQTSAATICSILIVVVAGSLSGDSNYEDQIGAQATATNQSESVKLKSQLEPIGPCMLDAAISFAYPRSHPPTSVEGLAEMCKRQSDAFKCIKNGSKTTPALIRRGLVSFVSNRQRANKKYCTNVNSEQSRRFVQDFKCLMENRFAQYKAVDIEYINTLNELERAKLNNSALELKYFCCATFKLRRKYPESVGKECESANRTVSELMASTIPNDINLICDDEDKLTKVCAELDDDIKVSKEFDPTTSQSPSVTGLYLVATLGEAE